MGVLGGFILKQVSAYTFANTHSMVIPTVNDGAEIAADTFYPKNGGEQAFTLEAWVKTPPISGGGNFLVMLINGNSNLTINLQLTSTRSARFRIRNTLSNYFQLVTTNGFVSFDTWYHMVGVYAGDYTQGSASMAMYINGASEGIFQTAGTFTGIEDLSAGSKLAFPLISLSDDRKINFSRWYDADMSANIATMYNGGVVPDLSGESFFGNIVSEMPFNNGVTALIGPDGTEVGTPTYDTDIPS